MNFNWTGFIPGMVAIFMLRGKWNGPIISCETDQPLVEMKANFYSEEKFGYLQQDLTTFIEAEYGNALNSKTFLGTRGIVVKFNKEGIPDLDEEFPPLYRYFKR
eukprot:UN13119